uniref:Uncharacterized protein n=1 Tax=Kalanchoe fedtschenkoi TaxID=63787 RepID=A0A7N0VEU6_KALFE
MQAREIELLVVKEPALKYDSLSNVPIFNSGVTLPWTDDMELLEFEETMGRLKDVSNSCATHMMLAYRKKLKSEQEAE